MPMELKVQAPETERPSGKSWGKVHIYKQTCLQFARIDLFIDLEGRCGIESLNVTT